MPAIEMMIQCTISHCKTEEAMLADCGYPDPDDHRQLHKHPINKKKAFSAKSAKNAETEALLKFLNEWWLKHINHEDRNCVPSVLNK